MSRFASFILQFVYFILLLLLLRTEEWGIPLHVHVCVHFITICIFYVIIIIIIIMHIIVILIYCHTD